MSQHRCHTTRGATRVLVTIGYDLPLNYVFMTVLNLDAERASRCMHAVLVCDTPGSTHCSLASNSCVANPSVGWRRLA